MSQDSISELKKLRQVIAGLQHPACFNHPVAKFETIETHISIVLLTGAFAYKFKKPLNLGFVDFTSLAKRRHFCEEELRLNRRLAPELYLEVLAVGGDVDCPRLKAEPAMEYCVKMCQFPLAAELEQVMQAGRIDPRSFIILAETIAKFHEDAKVASVDLPYGAAETIRRECLDNFAMIGGGIPELNLGNELLALKQWTEAELDRTQAHIEQRRRDGRVRECHGDMHVTNMIWRDERIQVFDCIEFNAEFRWIDVMSEIAFLLMDLTRRGRPDLAAVFRSAYLEAAGDYRGLDLLDLFCVYRSLVRAKIAYLRALQERADNAARRRFAQHVRLAEHYTARNGAAALIITHGLSGSGKTKITEALIPLTGAIRVRSDIERKRLAGLEANANSHSCLGGGLYGEAETERTYQRLADCARFIINAGLPAIIDAAFLKVEQRRYFRLLAKELGVPFRILCCQAPTELLRQRIIKRRQTGGNASEADINVLESQLLAAEPLTAGEEQCRVLRGTLEPADVQALAGALGLPLLHPVLGEG